MRKKKMENSQMLWYFVDSKLLEDRKSRVTYDNKHDSVCQCKRQTRVQKKKNHGYFQTDLGFW